MNERKYIQQHLLGFTLIEILVAMAIFTLIGLAATQVLDAANNANQITEERLESLQKLQRTMMTIERDILQTVSRSIRTEVEQTNVVLSGGINLFESEADGIGFVRGGRHNPQLILARSTLQPVAYVLKEKQLQRLYGNYVDNPIGYEPKVKSLLNKVEDFQVEFLAGQSLKPDGEPNWLETYTGTELPIAVAITIETEKFGSIRREFFIGG
jgi:general secretion pathway protein J